MLRLNIGCSGPQYGAGLGTGFCDPEYSAWDGERIMRHQVESQPGIG